MTLDEIAAKYGTDKATIHAIHAHAYTPHYEKFFEPLRNQPIKMLEIGVGGAESIKTWLEYFPKAQVFGLDIVKDTNPWNTPHTKPDERYTFVHGDQSDETMWKCFAADHGGDWDIVIDDGGHYNHQIIIAFRSLWPKVKSGGLYCIEDLGVGSDPASVFLGSSHPKHMDFIKELLEEINQKSEISWMNYSKELAIFKKA